MWNLIFLSQQRQAAHGVTLRHEQNEDSFIASGQIKHFCEYFIFYIFWLYQFTILKTSFLLPTYVKSIDGPCKRSLWLETSI